MSLFPGDNAKNQSVLSQLESLLEKQLSELEELHATLIGRLDANLLVPSAPTPVNTPAAQFQQGTSGPHSPHILFLQHLSEKITRMSARVSETLNRAEF